MLCKDIFLLDAAWVVVYLRGVCLSLRTMLRALEK